jgi:hypothetical protein
MRRGPRAGGAAHDPDSIREAAPLPAPEPRRWAHEHEQGRRPNQRASYLERAAACHEPQLPEHPERTRRQPCREQHLRGTEARNAPAHETAHRKRNERQQRIDHESDPRRLVIRAPRRKRHQHEPHRRCQEKQIEPHHGRGRRQHGANTAAPERTGTRGCLSPSNLHTPAIPLRAAGHHRLGPSSHTRLVHGARFPSCKLARVRSDRGPQELQRIAMPAGYPARPLLARVCLPAFDLIDAQLVQAHPTVSLYRQV